ncbi:hypothetical protein [Streptomyces sp. NPDC006739]
MSGGAVLKFAGALYLIHLGVQTWRHRGELAAPDSRTATRTRS